MQTIGKIINGKYVRYGAVSVGDKLGDAAFANIVNNATTTEEGFVPDARVVAQQQQIITQQQEQIDSLNSAMPSVIKYLGVLTLETGIDNADTGYYRLSKYPIDGIDTWGTLLCINSSVLDAQQLILGNYGRAGIMYRWKNNGSWVGWKTMQII